MSQNTLIPSQHQLRAELEAMVLGDLLGPAGGESEELVERNVRDRYLVGVLAPSRSGAAVDSVRDEEEPDEDTPLIPDELAEGGSDTADDGTTDQNVPAAAAHSDAGEFAFDRRFAGNFDQLSVGQCGKIVAREPLGPQPSEEDVLQTDPTGLDLNPESRESLEHVATEGRDIFDQRPDDLARFLAVIDGHQIVDALRKERIGLGQELDAVAVRIVRRRRLELLGWLRQQHHPLGKFIIGNGAHNSLFLNRAS